MLKKFLLVLGIALFLGCGTAAPVSGTDSGIVRPAAEVPDSFSAVFSTPVGSNDCQSRLVDPVDQVELVLMRSSDGVGDYLVPLGKYRMSSEELLRIDCKTGRVIGVVKK